LRQIDEGVGRRELVFEQSNVSNLEEMGCTSAKSSMRTATLPETLPTSINPVTPVGSRT